MRKNYKKVIIGLIVFLIPCLLFGGLVYNSNKSNSAKLAKEINIEEVLRTDAYSYLPAEAKDYIRKVYNETGKILLTEKNKEDYKDYLNPEFIKYLQDKKDYSVIPNDTRVDFVYDGSTGGSEDLPRYFDLRNVDGKNFVTPFKNQGAEGLCWDYATNAHLESFLLQKANKSYDETAVILSEKQIDYATANNGLKKKSLYESYVFRDGLSSSGNFIDAMWPIVDGLGMVPQSWDDEHRDKISKNQPLDPSDVYNSNNSLYEVDSYVDIPYFDYENGSEEERTSYLNMVKRLVMENGGAYFTTKMLITYNYYGDSVNEEYNNPNGEYIPVVYLPNNYFGSVLPHALQLIGWNDDVEYVSCGGVEEYVDSHTTCKNGVVAEGKGVWILKNSWGADNYTRITYVPYSSTNSTINIVTSVDTRRWDNFYEYEYTKPSNHEDYSLYSIYGDESFANEKLEKIKFKIYLKGNYDFYLTNSNGEDRTLIGTVDVHNPGLYTLDVGDENITIGSDMYIEASDYVGRVKVYTSNKTDDINIVSQDMVYNHETEKYQNSDNYEFDLYSRTKNIEPKEELQIRIKDSNNSYVDESYYDISDNKVYENRNVATMSIDTNHFSIGDYVLEICYDSDNCTTANLTIDYDFMKTLGEGTKDSPWQITNVRQFDLIRNYPNDNFKLMNDIDFEYDTQDPNGLLYNDGKGYKTIPLFSGCFDGNYHQLQNVYSNSEVGTSLFGSITIDGNCGVKNTQLYNPSFVGGFEASGIALSILIKGPLSPGGLSNNAVIGGSIRVFGEDVEYVELMAGGVYGRVNTTFLGEQGVIISNLFNSADIQMTNSSSGKIFGLLGSVTSEQERITIKDSINIGKLKCSSCDSLALVGTSDADISSYTIDNIISLGNSSVPIVKRNQFGPHFSFNNIYSTSSKLIDDNDSWGNSSNTLLNMSVFDVANADYSNWANFSNNWNQSQEGGVNRIPILKNINYDYFRIAKEVNLNVGESLDLLTLVLNDKYNDELTFSKNCSLDIAVCESSTDETIVSLSNSTITALKDGTTTVIAKNSHDGYVGAITIVVGGEVSNKKTITFDSNNGSYETKYQEFISNEAFNLNDNPFEYAGYEFRGWNTSRDGTGTNYANSQEVTFANDVTLYAIWELGVYTVTFNPNGGTGNIEPQVFRGTEEKPLSLNTFVREDYDFNCWSTLPDGTGTRYNDGEKISISSDITLYAIYTRIRYYVVFDFGDGNTDSLKALSGDSLERPANPTREGYIFVDWYADSEFTTLYDFSKPVRGPTTIYAKWRIPVVTWEINGGKITDGFNNTEEKLVGTVLTLEDPSIYHIEAPNKNEFDAYEINGARYLINQQYTINDDVTIKCLWKKKTNIEPDEAYIVSYKKINTRNEELPYGTNVSSYINDKKALFKNSIDEFANGKENITISSYNDLFTDNKYIELDSFYLKNTINGEDEITYEYEVKYNEVIVSVELLKEDNYTLNLVEEKEIELTTKDDVVSYIANKKDKFMREVKDLDIDALFIIDIDNNVYKYAEYINTEKVDSKEENGKLINNYKHNYNLVTINLKEEYILYNNDNTIVFREKIGIVYELSIVDLLDDNKEEITNRIEAIKKEVEKKKDILLGVYRIEVKTNQEEKHNGPFRLKIKLKDNMKNYKKYYMVYLDDNGKTKEKIEFTKNGDYVEGTLEHLSEYVLIGEEDTLINPKTADKLLLVVLVFFISVFVLVSLKKKKLVRFN